MEKKDLVAEKMMSAFEALVEKDFFSGQPKDIINAISLIQQLVLQACSSDFVSYINVWNKNYMQVLSMSEDKFLELQNRATEIFKSYGYNVK